MPRISHVGLTLTRVWCKLCLILLTAKGQTLTLRGSSPIAVLGDSFQFTCTVTGGGSLQGLLYLTRGPSPSISTPCTVNTAGCSQINNSPGYTCGCVSGQTGVFYTNISSVSRDDDDDNWRCQYSGITSSSVSLDVYYSPIISSVPSNKSVTENTSPNIDCSSNVTHGNPSSTSYRWTGPGGYSKTGAVLDRTVTRNQGGEYTCTATNTAGLSDTAMVIINVQYAPVITSVPRNKDVTENTSPNINCSSNISPGNPLSISGYRWTGPGGYSKSGAVLDRNVTKYQRGQYTCTATNTAGLSDTAQVIINVQYAPVITSVSSKENVTENTSPNIDCSSNITSGNPSSTIYRWTGPGGYSKNGAVLDRTVTRTQGGQYTCIATNTAGLSDTATVNVNVQHAPTITSIPNKNDVAENTSPNIDCSSNIISGNPSSISGYRWTGPGSYSKTGAVLDRTVTRAQGGQYTCIATNTIGLSDTATVNINVISPPLSPAKFDSEFTSVTFALLVWTSKFNGGGVQLFYLEYEDGVSHIKTQGIADPGIDKVVTWNISKLDPETPYSFTLYSENIYLRSDSVTLNITTAKLSLEKLSENNSGIGRGIGIGFGICLPIITGLSIGVIFLVYKQHDTKKKYKETVERDTTQTEVQATSESSIDERSYSVLHHDASKITQYERIQMEQKGTDESRQYENLDTEKTKGKSNIYENQEGTEKTDINLYEDPI